MNVLATSALLLSAASPGFDLGRCYTTDEPRQLVLTAYGDQVTKEVGLVVTGMKALNAEGLYTSNVALLNHVTGYDAAGRVVLTLAEPRASSWVSSLLTATYFDEDGMATREEELECFDQSFAPTKGTIVIGRGVVRAGLWSAVEMEERARKAADADGLARCVELLGADASASRVSAYTEEQTFEVPDVIQTAEARYRCRS